jgi:polyprenyldihydroxybenzoate methyltransferase/3-demethylubiquinol 3-O-methyltransferase
MMILLPVYFTYSLTSSLQVEEMSGFVYNPFTQWWSLSDDISINYIAYGIKRSETPSTISQ